MGGRCAKRTQVWMLPCRPIPCILIRLANLPTPSQYETGLAMVDGSVVGRRPSSTQVCPSLFSLLTFPSLSVPSVVNILL